VAATSQAIKTQGELEAAVCEVVNRFHRDTIGRGPRTISATVRSRTVIVHLEGVLSKIEDQLAASASRDGIAMVRQIRDQLVQGARSSLLRNLAQTLGQSAVAMMHDVDPEADVAVLVFTPACEPKSIRLRA
jgi:uncharacterized protein YbcI